MYQKITADQLFNGYHLVEGHPVLVLDGRGVVLDVIDRADAGEDVRKLSGILSPGFINAHCHLELSHLQFSIDEGQGLIAFISSVMQQRKASDDIIQLAMEKADEKMLEHGIVAVGDICNSDISVAVKQSSKIHYHSFVEVAGFPEDIAVSRFDYALQIAQTFATLGMPYSIVPHAPYSVSDKLMQLICSHRSNKVLSIHNQETADENLWFMNKQGGFEQFYRTLHIDTNSFEASGKTSLQHVLPFLNPIQSTIFVHNVHSSAADITAAQERFKPSADQLYFCLCPNANQYISGQMPDLTMFQQKGVQLVLGTDSLASNHQLDMMSEMQTLQHHFPKLQLDEMLRWATINGAKALGIDNQFGSFEKGKNPGVVVIEKNKAKRMI